MGLSVPSQTRATFFGRDQASEAAAWEERAEELFKTWRKNPELDHWGDIQLRIAAERQAWVELLASWRCALPTWGLDEFLRTLEEAGFVFDSNPQKERGNYYNNLILVDFPPGWELVPVDGPNRPNEITARLVSPGGTVAHLLINDGHVEELR